jgi:tRNA nucleotidyltransferase (CCA-adding enzyme)
VSEAAQALVPDGERVLEALAALPGGPQLLRLAETREDIALIGGATRDLLIGRTPRELDVVLSAGAGEFAQELAGSIGAAEALTVTVHERFGTASVEWQAGRIDVAERRAETYGSPGALPEVRPGTVEEDLRRRDFTVNAIAAPLAPDLRGTLQAAPDALEDLAAGHLRVTYDESFIEDPTRLLRLARYSARLGFQPEQRTAQLAAEALEQGALAAVSRARVGAELRLALAEADAVRALSALGAMEVLSAIEPWLRFDPALATCALAILPDDGRPEILLLGQLLLASPPEALEDREQAMFELLDALEFTAADRDRAIRTALAAPTLPATLREDPLPSRLHEELATRTPEAVALAGAIGEQEQEGSTGEAARRWLETLRQVRLSITGDDLLAAGIAPGPEIGRRLQAALHRKLDGDLADGAEAELRAALEAGE